MPTLHFTIGDGFHELVRQAYWFEDRKQWALDVLNCLHGITEEQKMKIINGDAKLVPNEDGTRLQMIEEEDLKFKQKLVDHQQFIEENYTTIEGHKIQRSYVDEYVDFVVKRYRLSLRCPHLFLRDPELVLQMEQIRTAMHNRIVECAGFKKREGREYLKFAVAIDKLVSEAEKKYGMTPIYRDSYELREEMEKKYPLIMNPQKEDE